jgi:uncharacterized protein (TIGR02300 family)
MEATERGRRHICPECTTRYYDLNRSSVACPKCGATSPAPKLVRAARPPKEANRVNGRMNTRRFS